MPKNISPGMRRAFAVLDLQADQVDPRKARAADNAADQIISDVNFRVQAASEVNFTL